MNYLSKILSISLSIFVWIFIAIISTVLLIALLLLKPFDPDQKKISYKIPNLWGYLIYKANPFWQFDVLNADQIRPDQGYVIVANHKSLSDIICMHLLQKHFKWVAKESLFRIPVMGWGMALANYIPLARDQHGSIKTSYAEAIKWLDKDVSVVIFPEGTRIKGDQLGSFKNGAFKLAIEAKKPIIPVVLHGTSQAMAKGSKTMAVKVEVKIQVLPPISTDGYETQDFGKLRDSVRKIMENEYLHRDKEKVLPS
jgi:1-acyl-sn-glycerol-3-phosphate acyltransferase